MKILVSNLGSTSFKYRLFRFEGEAEESIADGGFERVTDFGAAIGECLDRLCGAGHLGSIGELDGVGFKTVLGKELSGCVEADDRAIRALEEFSDVAPAHNPVYAEAIRQFGRIAPSARLVALFETSFYRWMPEAAGIYAVPQSWHDAGIRRYGFHGASHKFVAERSAELQFRPDVADRVRRLYVDGPGDAPERPLRVISCHLGGSSSVTGIASGVAIGTSMGFSPQSGLPQNNRVGDLDAMAVPFAVKHLGIDVAEAERELSKEGGLAAVSGVSNDLRDIKAAAARGDRRARLAVDLLVHGIRQWAGGFFWQMGGCEAIVFTGGIGENNPDIRDAVCCGMEDAGIRLDPAANERVRGCEGAIGAADSRVAVLVIPANEELVVARETRRFLERSRAVR